jgi:hypothetical protein
MQQLVCAALSLHVNLQLAWWDKCPGKQPKERNEITLAGSIWPYQHGQVAKLEVGQVSNSLETPQGDARQSQSHSTHISRLLADGKPYCGPKGYRTRLAVCTGLGKKEPTCRQRF